jgi:hypothetical protein
MWLAALRMLSQKRGCGVAVREQFPPPFAGTERSHAMIEELQRPLRDVDLRELALLLVDALSREPP